ncbi:hypothetical protein FJT64_027280 [Amphibalanus amphitrite]|uniref:Peptidase A2 domain-containing protein n=1 Tax=Amphibalanus amphitrite TaxID=1232801 RepID=A0A6A4W4C2_AMPAM|nr:hypothetical protein FJT64_027280 [Amphibalanus amphitrite]
MEAQGMTFPTVARYSPGGDFGRWLREVDRYMAAVGIQDSNRKSAVLLHLIGPDVADLVDTLPEETDATAEADDYDKLKKKLTAYLSPVRNTVAERSAFHQMRMEASEDLEHFLGRLRAQIALCSYPATETDTELRDQCVLGCRAGLQEKLVQLAASKRDKLTLEEVRQAGRAHRDLQQLGAQLAATRAAERPAAAVTVTVPVNGVKLNMLVDSGSPVTAVGRDTLIPGLQLRPSPLHLTSFTGHVIPLIGEAFTYDVELRPSENMHLADSLSRMAVPGRPADEPAEAEEDNSGGSHLLFMDGVAPVLTAGQIATATRRDRLLSRCSPRTRRSRLAGRDSRRRHRQRTRRGQRA